MRVSFCSHFSPTLCSITEDYKRIKTNKLEEKIVSLENQTEEIKRKTAAKRKQLASNIAHVMGRLHSPLTLTQHLSPLTLTPQESRLWTVSLTPHTHTAPLTTRTHTHTHSSRKKLTSDIAQILGRLHSSLTLTPVLVPERQTLNPCEFLP